VGRVALVSTDTELPDAQGDRLIHSATALLISNGSSAVLGLVFWVIAARLYTVNDVGLGTAEVSAMLLLASISQLNLGIIFPRYLFAAGSKAQMVVRVGYLSSMVAGFIFAAVFLLVFHHTYVEAGTFATVFFIAAVVLWVVFSIQDAALIGLRATFWVPVENTSFSVAKVLLLPVFVAVAPRDGVFLSWVLPVVLCIAGISYYLFGKVLPKHLRWSAGRGSLPSRRVTGTVLGGEYLAGLAYIALTTVPALLIAARLGFRQAGYFQVPWLAGTTFDFMLYYLATSLISEASARPTDAPAVVRRAVRLTAWLLVPGAIVLVVGARYFLDILGSSYPAHGTRLLQYLALALPFMGVNVLYITFARLARRVRRIMWLPVTLSFVILGMSDALVSRLGITAIGVAFLSGQGLVALIALPSVVRQYRRPDMSPGFAPDAPLVAKGQAIDPIGVIDVPVGEPLSMVAAVRWRSRRRNGAPSQTDGRGAPPRAGSGDSSNEPT
jgi:O-antigen/teichoic acid export membrane protein